MDVLSDKESILAWRAVWNPSFVGKAIVNQDFTFRYVNPQFCKILGVTGAELLNQKFTDLTPEPLKTLDKRNAELVIKRAQESYLLPKTYEFSSGRRVDVTLLVTGVYCPETGSFMFFISQILERVKKSTATDAQSPKQTKFIEIVDIKKWFWTVSAGIGLILATMAERLFK